jgi:hypothetical protein
MSGELTIDRLILDIPGLDAEKARSLAERIGAGLAGASGEFTSLLVHLDDAPDEPPENLPARIVQALQRQMEGD